MCAARAGRRIGIFTTRPRLPNNCTIAARVFAVRRSSCPGNTHTHTHGAACSIGRRNRCLSVSRLVSKTNINFPSQTQQYPRLPSVLAGSSYDYARVRARGSREEKSRSKVSRRRDSSGRHAEPAAISEGYQINSTRVSANVWDTSTAVNCEHAGIAFEVPDFKFVFYAYYSLHLIRRWCFCLDDCERSRSLHKSVRFSNRSHFGT